MLEHKIQFYGRRKGRKLSKEKNRIINLLGPKVFFDNGRCIIRMMFININEHKTVIVLYIF